MTAELAAEGELQSTSLVELTVRRLRSEILSGALVPGERLIEEQLTKRFGTSRGPLREAMRLLGEQGLVEHSPRRGVRVAELSGRDISELFSLRDVLEQFAVHRALGEGRCPDPDAMAALTESVQRLEHLPGDGAAVEQATAHRAFHIALVSLAGHNQLLRVYEPVLLQLQLYMATNLRREAQEHPGPTAGQRHRRLYDAIRAGDLEAALVELERHGARTYLAPELGEA